jgi:hypothetical protein
MSTPAARRLQAARRHPGAGDGPERRRGVRLNRTLDTGGELARVGSVREYLTMHKPLSDMSVDPGNPR